MGEGSLFFRHVLFVGNDAGYFRSHRLDLARVLLEHGRRVSAILPDSDSASAIEVANAGIDVYTYPFYRGSMNPLTEVRALVALWRLYRRLAPDIVHHLTVKPVLYGGIVARVVRVPIRIHALLGLGHLFYADDLKTVWARRVLTPAFRFALGGRNSRVLVQNPDDLDVLRRDRLLSPSQAESAKVILGSGVDPNQFDVTLEPLSPPVVLFAGRLTTAKGVREFVQAAEILRRRGEGARYVICGAIDVSNPGQIREAQLKSWVEEGAVEWWGYREDIGAVLASVSMVVLPSLYGEGVPKILIEAAAAGRPIVTTDTPGCREIVRNGVNGWLVPPGDSDALADAIHCLLREPDTRRRMGLEGRKRVEESFSLQRVIEQTLTVYNELLNSA